MKLNQIDTKPTNSFKKAIKNIAELTDENNHTEAIIQGLQFLGNDNLIKNLVKDALKIKNTHEADGHLTSAMSQKRKVVYDKMMSIAKKRLSSSQFKLFYGAF